MSKTLNNLIIERYLEINNKYTKIENFLLAKYDRSELVKYLIPAIPKMGGIIDKLLSDKLIDFQQEKLDKFFYELSHGDIILTEEVRKSNDFANYCYITMEAVLKCNVIEKIDCFAKLLKNSISIEVLLKDGIYEEYLSILEELSYRELIILTELYNLEKENENKFSDNMTDLQKCSLYWNQFILNVQSKFDYNMSKGEIEAILSRITRTGCYREITGAYIGYTGGKGRLTPIFYKLIEYIND